MKDSVLKTKKLSVGYNKKIVAGDIEISVKQGEILTIIGANGSGKSTILKSITGQLKLISGAVFIDNRNLDNFTRKELSRKMSVVMTDRIETELMTCRDIVEYGRFPYTNQSGILSSSDRLKADEAMHITDTYELAERDFSRISDGQKQRVLLARAVCQEPEVLILDEPTSFLDIRYKLELLSILKRLVREKNIAVIMSLHELDLVQRISDHVLCIDGEKADRYGTPEEIFSGDYISRLYKITSGSYERCIPELDSERGIPKIFVISGNGTGINTFHKLQRMNIPFASGILHENDIDYFTAKRLAETVISEKAFEPLSQENFIKAKNIIDSCEKVICCINNFGTMNILNRNLKKYAEEKNKMQSI